MPNLKEHLCSSLDLVNNADSFTVTIIRENGNWYLHYAAYANDLMVRSGEADYIGEEVTEISILIEFCPYCGFRLLDGK